MTQPAHPSTAETELRRFFAQRGLDPNSVAVETGVDTALAFYRDVRFGPLTVTNSDMLLFQWGTYDWGEGEHFELDVTRQLIWPSTSEEDDEEMWQLSLTFRFEPSAELRALGSGSKWCEQPSKLTDLRKYIAATQAFQGVSTRKPKQVDLHFGSAE